MSHDIYSIEDLENKISDLKSAPEVIEFLWMYDFCGNYDYAYINCHVYIKKGNLLERKFIGHVEILPINQKFYYENLSKLASDLGKYIEDKYNAINYFPSEHKVDCENISWEEKTKFQISNENAKTKSFITQSIMKNVIIILNKKKENKIIQFILKIFKKNIV